MKPPTNLTELLDHLAAHPKFRTESNHPLVRQYECEFVDYSTDRLWFRSADGKLRFFAAEFLGDFRPAGFTVRQFSVTVTCTFQE